MELGDDFEDIVHAIILQGFFQVLNLNEEIMVDVEEIVGISVESVVDQLKLGRQATGSNSVELAPFLHIKDLPIRAGNGPSQAGKSSFVAGSNAEATLLRRDNVGFGTSSDGTQGWCWRRGFDPAGTGLERRGLRRRRCSASRRCSTSRFGRRRLGIWTHSRLRHG